MYKYPETLPQPPVDKWILFEVKAGRHVVRDTVIVEGGGPDRTLANIGLYLSESALSSTTAVKYDGGTDLGPFAGAALEFFAQTGKNMADSQPNTGESTGIWGFLKTLTGQSAEFINSSFGDALKADLYKGINAVTNDAAARITGTKPNPRTDILFDTQEYRTHDLSFLMVPRSLNEAKSIDNIIRIFQYYMLPAYQGKKDKTGAFLIGFPYEFVITIMDGSTGKAMEHINKIGRSVLTSIAVDHAPDSKPAFVKDNGEYYPVASAISLKFQEVRLLARDSDEITRKGTDALLDPRAN